MKARRIITAIVLGLFPVHARATDLRQIVTEAAGQYAAVIDVQSGDKGTPIVVIEERHDLLRAAVEESLVLERLRREASLNDIALEGYLKTSSSDVSAAGKTMSLGTATRRLESGEISSAEFMHSVHGVRLHAIESAAEYRQPKDLEAVSQLFVLQEIALANFKKKLEAEDLDPSMREKVLAFQKRIEEAATSQEKQRQIFELRLALVDWDPWTKKVLASGKRESACGATPESIAQSIIDAEELDAKVKELNITLDPELKKSHDAQLQFLKQRDAASGTMVKNTIAIADSVEHPIAMIIGAGHTERVVKLFRAAGRPYAILRPMALGECASSSSESRSDRERYSRLTKGLPIDDGILGAAAVKAYPNEIKPRPLSEYRWFKAREETMDLASKFARRALTGSGDGGGDGPTSPPAAFASPEEWRRFFGDDDKRRKLIGAQSLWTGTYASVDSERARGFVDPKTDDDVLIFPVILNPGDPRRRQEVWIRARRRRESYKTEIRETEKKPPAEGETETALIEALERVKSGKQRNEEIKPETLNMIAETPDIEIVAAKSLEEATAGLKQI